MYVLVGIQQGRETGQGSLVHLKLPEKGRFRAPVLLDSLAMYMYSPQTMQKLTKKENLGM